MKSKKMKIIHHKSFMPKPEKNFSSLIWQTHEFIKPEPTVSWYCVWGIVATAIIVLLIILKQYGLTISVLLIAMLVVLEVSLEPRLVRVEINEGGVNFGEKKYPFFKIKSYSIIKIGEKKLLELDTTMPILSNIDIPIGKQSEEELRIFLDKYIPYVHRQMSSNNIFLFWK